MASYGLIEIKSNDGSQTLLVPTQVDSFSPIISVTSTGVTQGSSFTYSYSGDKTFLGVATVTNATEPTYAVGNDYTLSIGSMKTLTLYIVEGDKAPTLTYDLSQLDLAAGTHSITVRAKADGYADSEPSNTVEYVVKESVPTNLTGYTVTVPAGWSATAGYYYNQTGEGSFVIFDGDNIRGTFTGVAIGYSVNFDTMALRELSNSIMFGNEFGFGDGPYGSSHPIVLGNFTGAWATDSTLIQWFVDNNATFEKTA